MRVTSQQRRTCYVVHLLLQACLPTMVLTYSFIALHGILKGVQRDVIHPLLPA